MGTTKAPDPGPATISGLHIRSILSRDLPTVLMIETESFDEPWQENDFIQAIQQRNQLVWVADRGGVVVGFLVYGIRPNSIQLVNLAVSAVSRRQGIGRGMMEWLQAKLSTERRNRITLEVSERNLHAQLFFKAMKFRAINVNRARFPDGTDTYLMKYQVRKPTLAGVENANSNRIDR
jgi:[ribosomal protein S18]-alanine N-acetyltransferase